MHRGLLATCLAWALGCLLWLPCQAQTRTTVIQEDMGYVNAHKYGAAKTSVTLAAAIAAQGSLVRTLVLPVGTWTISADVVVPATLTLKIPAGAVLSVASTKRVTTLGPLHIDGCDVFTGAGDVVPLGPVTLVPCWWGAKCNGTFNDQPALAKLAASVKVAGGVIDLPQGTCRTNSTSPLFAVTDPGGAIWLRGQGILNTTLRQEGAGHGLVVTCTIDCAGMRVSGLTLEGTNIGLRGLNPSGWQDSVIEHVNFNGWIGDSLRLDGVQSLHVTVRDSRFSAGAAASSTGRAIRAVGNQHYFENNYFNIGSNISRYDTALDVIGCGGCSSHKNVFDGVATAIRSRLPFSTTSDYCEASSPNPVRVPTFLVHDANNTLTISHNLGASLNPANPCFVNFAGTDRRYLVWTSSSIDATLNMRGGMSVLRVLPSTILPTTAHDFQPTDASDTSLWILDTNGAVERTITGIVGGYNGRLLTLYNTGDADILLANNDSGSTAGNRILVTDGLTYRLHKRASITMFYTDLNATWRVTDNHPSFIGSTKTTVDFSAPGTVPGCVESADVTLTGAALGDVPLASASVARLSQFAPVAGYVRVADKVRFVWCQISGTATDPDGAGADYRIHLSRTP